MIWAIVLCCLGTIAAGLLIWHLNKAEKSSREMMEHISKTYDEEKPK